MGDKGNAGEDGEGDGDRGDDDKEASDDDDDDCPNLLGTDDDAEPDANSDADSNYDPDNPNEDEEQDPKRGVDLLSQPENECDQKLKGVYKGDPPSPQHGGTPSWGGGKR